MPAKRTQRTRRQAAVRVRMYRIGFGDCFLVSFRGRPTRHVLVDCGVHNRGDIGRLQAAVADIVKETQGKLALVIATHAHEDHISGFGKYAAQFASLQVGEVWMPWSEDPSDVDAVRLKRRSARLLARLAQHFAAVPPSAAARDALSNLAASGNTAALDSLRNAFGTGGTTRFLSAGSTITAPGGIDELTARVLGPPRNEAFLRRMDPPRDQRFLRLNAAGEVEPLDEFLPFPGLADVAEKGPRLGKADERALQEWAEAGAEGIAFALTEVVNNTSLVVMFSYKGRELLFPGDAQYGNWQSWIEGEDGSDLLSRVHFYKVAHHGSGNATPRGALEGMTHDHLAAMVSTQSTPWPSIPQGNLMEAISTQTGGRLTRSDWVGVPGATTATRPAKFPESFREGDFWIDWEA